MFKNRNLTYFLRIMKLFNYFPGFTMTSRTFLPRIKIAFLTFYNATGVSDSTLMHCLALQSFSELQRLPSMLSNSVHHKLLGWEIGTVNQFRFYFCQYQLKMSPAWDRIRPKPASSVDGTRQGKSPSDGKTTTDPTTTIIQDEATEEEDADVEEKGVGTSAAATTTTYDEGNISCCCRCRYLWQINQHIS